MDKIFIRELAVTTIIGTRPEERNVFRTILLDVELSLDLRPAGEKDDLCSSVNYQAVAERLLELGRTSQFLLIEAFAENAAKLILSEFPLVESVRLTVDKPGAIGSARSVAVEIVRHR